MCAYVMYLLLVGSGKGLLCMGEECMYSVCMYVHVCVCMFACTCMYIWKHGYCNPKGGIMEYLRAQPEGISLYHTRVYNNHVSS